MNRACRLLILATLLTIGLTSSHEARAQGPIYQSSNVIVMKPPAPAVVITGPQTRREARRQARARRLAMRPTYPANTRDPIGFAPFSDRYAQRAVVVTTPAPPYSGAGPR